jgi:hypothetical protein
VKQYAVIFSHSNNVDLDGYDGLNPDDPRRQCKAVFDTHQEAKAHADARAAALPDCRFTVVEVEV